LLRSAGCSLSVTAYVRAKDSLADVPDNRPLSNGSVGRLWPDEHVAVKAMPPYPHPGVADAAAGDDDWQPLRYGAV
jgi:hypothetical protein